MNFYVHIHIFSCCILQSTHWNKQMFNSQRICRHLKLVQVMQICYIPELTDSQMRYLYFPMEKSREGDKKNLFWWREWKHNIMACLVNGESLDGNPLAFSQNVALESQWINKNLANAMWKILKIRKKRDRALMR